MSQTLKWLIGVIVVVLLAVLSANFLVKRYREQAINDFDECKNAGYPILETFPEQCKTPSGKTFINQAAAGGDITVSGEVVCLSPKDTGGPQTTECAYGIKTDTGSYGLGGSSSSYLLTLTDGERVTVRGKVMPAQESKYDIVGIIEATATRKETN